MRALVVEDDRVTRRSVVGLLEQLGFGVVEAADGSEALDHLSGAERFDLSLVDWMLPGISGVDVVRAIRANPAHEAMRVMMVTIRNERDDVRQALEVGADEYLMKPVERHALLSKLELLGLTADRG